MHFMIFMKKVLLVATYISGEYRVIWNCFKGGKAGAEPPKIDKLKKDKKSSN